MEVTDDRQSDHPNAVEEQAIADESGIELTEENEKIQDETNDKPEPLEIEQDSKEKEDVEEPPRGRSMLLADVVKDWFASMLIGFLVVSYWRGTWTLLDIWDCNQSPQASVILGQDFCGQADVRQTKRRDSGFLTYWISIILLAFGVVLLWAGFWRPKRNAGIKPFVTKTRSVTRFLLLYNMGWAAVCMWRGVWYLTDYYVLYDDPVASWWTTAVAGLGGLFLLLAGASALAPPAMFILDGPSDDSPPIGVTLLTSFFDITLPATEKPPETHWTVYIIDIVVSFIGVPILVVWFWRGCWALCDEYLWGFTVDSGDFNRSLVYSALIGVGCLVFASDDIMYFIPFNNKNVYRMFCRLRTTILGLGAVNFWRVFWYVWDEYMSTDSHASAWLAHAIGIVGLLFMGCMSCTVAPPSTIGVDVLAHPECSDEPLFSNIPVPNEALFLFGIGRQPLEPKKIEEQEALDEEERKRQFRQHAMEHLEELGGATRHLLPNYYEAQRYGKRPARKGCGISEVLNKRSESKRDDWLFRNR